MDRSDIARALEEIAAFLELKGETPFRVRAYHQAARAVQGFAGDLDQAVRDGRMAALKGVGPATLEIIEELRAAGHSTVLESLRAEIPPGLVEMLRISGLGIAKVRQIHAELGIDSLDELETAARDGRVAALPRFGRKTADNILKGITFLRQTAGQRLLHHALAEARDLVDVLDALPEVRRAAAVGDVRRFSEIITGLEFLVEPAGEAEALYDRLGRAPGVTEFVRREERAVTLRFASGTVADIHLARVEEWGFQLVQCTGNPDHLAALAAVAEGVGLGWSHAGVTRDGSHLPTPDEEAVYRLLGMDWVPPELREGLGEVRAAQDRRLPRLITRDEVKGFLHCHSTYSDGTSSIAEWAEAARAGGYGYIGITDHSQGAMYAGGLRGADIVRQHAEIDAVNRAHTRIHVLKGVEADILEDGTLDYTQAERERFDFVIASVHTRFGQDETAMTDRVLRAMDDPTVAIIGHPTGRLLLSRDPYPMDLARVFAAAAARGIAIEINADAQRLDLDWRLVREAAATGVTISIGADAHGVNQMRNADIGVSMARKAWLTAPQVLNTRPLEGFLEHVAARRPA